MEEGGSSNADSIFLKVREGPSGPGSTHSRPVCHLGLVDHRQKTLDCIVVYHFGVRRNHNFQGLACRESDAVGA